MRVKRLEIQGFKSFKDKTVIHFDHGITGIVGPNGCGKSNIVDAFFWVMGEQSYKHMRGSSSDDLIFNGSSRYSPLGVAEATMVLETDFVDTADAPAGATVQDVPAHLRSKEVSVTRRLYRSGEGEYFINGVHARLKDIQELFMDTGVGAKGYSVIEQGQIGKIVNSKPEERRLLVEEAAGIAKYKARKKESLRKMEATQSNLSRLNDVIQEIERNLNSLERQAQKARQYKKYKDELLDKEMTWGRRKAQVLRQKLESIRKQKDALEEELTGLRAAIQTSENSIETDRIEQTTDTKAAEELQAKIQALSDELTESRSALDLSRRRQSDLASQLQALSTERAELAASIETETARVAERETGAAESETSFQDAAVKAQTMDEEVRRIRQVAESARRELESAKKQLMNGIAQASDLNSRAASLLTRMEGARAQAERLADQAASQAEKLELSRSEAAKAKACALELNERKEKVQAERKTQQAHVQGQEQKLRQTERERDDSMRKLTQVKSRLQSLEELAESREGFGDGPKAALDWAREQGHEDKLFALADALEVPGEYEAAVEMLLENRIESLVASEPAIALDALNEVRGQNQGRLAIHVGAGASGHASYDGVRALLEKNGFQVEGKLADLVSINARADKPAREAAAQVLSGVCVIRDSGAITSFVGSGGLEKLGGWTVLSLDGTALEPGGVLRGGSSGNGSSASLLKRKRAIAELAAQAKEAEAAHQGIEQAVVEARQALEIARARLQTLQSDLQAIEVQAAALERDVHQMSRAARDAEEQLRQTELEKKRVEEQAEEAQASRAEIESRVEEIASQRSELEASISEGEAELLEKETQVRAQESHLQALRVEEASLRERAVSLKRELEAGRALISDRKRRMGEIERTLERASREQEHFTGGDSGLETRIQELTILLGKTREELSAVKDRLEQSNAKLGGAHERIKELRKSAEQKTGESTHLMLESEKINSDLAHLVQNLEEKYGPGCLERPVSSPIQEEMSEPVVTAEMTAEEELALGEEVERLRERIRRLGEVNPMAVEEYEDAKKRFDYLLAERTDLERSIENLKEAIEHINKTSEERFKKAYDAISNRFERLFPIIFGGGRAELSLVYPEGSSDILEAGIDILAQPPGKKVTNIGLLSGGEKALTAVSLIFAIFMVKPSPFCVLDEVDAPLDDANIGKFNALLKEMAAKSQFILITHNKKTMELNDTLYGVTMEEPGVSKMVSIEMH